MMEMHRFVMDDFETCSICGSDLTNASSDSVHWFGRRRIDEDE